MEKRRTVRGVPQKRTKIPAAEQSSAPLPASPGQCHQLRNASSEGNERTVGQMEGRGRLGGHVNGTFARESARPMFPSDLLARLLQGDHQEGLCRGSPA
eukprot:scaffold3518_cov189-Pinguiococcus_pyrenoidosus.AAC.3